MVRDRVCTAARASAGRDRERGGHHRWVRVARARTRTRRQPGVLVVADERGGCDNEYFYPPRLP